MLGDFLMEELYSFVGEGWEQEDDITLVTLRRTAAASRLTSKNTYLPGRTPTLGSSVLDSYSR
jgi:hypothetical protein